MKVIVYLIDGKEVLVGKAPIFDNNNYQAGCDKRLGSIGMWLEDWHYSGNVGAPHKGKVFIPWTSALYIVEELL